MKTEAAWPAPSGGSIGNARLYRNDGDDFHPARVHDHDVVADQEVLKAAPLRFDLDDGGRQPYQPYRTRHPRADLQREIDVGDPRRAAFLHDDLVNAGALLGRQIDVDVRCRTVLASF